MNPFDIRFYACSTMSKLEHDYSPDRAEEKARREMAERISEVLMKARATKGVNQDFVEWRIDLYIATPEQFWEIVQQEARKIAQMYGLRR